MNLIIENMKWGSKYRILLENLVTLVSLTIDSTMNIKKYKSSTILKEA